MIVVCKSTRYGEGCGHPVEQHDGKGDVLLLLLAAQRPRPRRELRPLQADHRRLPCAPAVTGQGRSTSLVCPRCMDNLVRHEGEFGYYCGRCNESWSFVPGRHATTITTAPARQS